MGGDSLHRLRATSQVHLGGVVGGILRADLPIKGQQEVEDCQGQLESSCVASWLTSGCTRRRPRYSIELKGSGRRR